MALAVTAVVTDPGRRVVLTVTGAAGPVSAVAYPATGASYTVRTPWSTSGASKVGQDGDVPLGVDTTYVVTDGTSSATSPVVRADSAVPILADATTPSLAVAVTVVDQLPNGWEARSVWWDVLGSRAPFASIAPLRFRNGELVLRCADRDERESIVALLATGVPFTLRTPCGDAVDDVIGLPSNVVEELVDEAWKNGPRLLRIAYQAIARELGPFLGNPARTYGDLVTEEGTYALLLADHTRYADVLSGVSG